MKTKVFVFRARGAAWRHRRSGGAGPFAATSTAGSAAAGPDIPRRSQLRRGRRARRRRAGQVRARPRRRTTSRSSKTASRSRSRVFSLRQHARRTRSRGRSLPSSPIEPDVQTNVSGYERPRLSDRARRPAHARRCCRDADEARGAPVRRALHGRQRRGRRRAHQRPRRRGAGVHQQPAAAAAAPSTSSWAGSCARR